MQRLRFTFLAAAVICLSGLILTGCATTDSTKTSESKPTAATKSAAVDLHNTMCVVSEEPIGDSKLTETYNGKTYHFCCDDCPKAFRKDPAKYERAVAANPAKYGVKGL